MLNDEYRRLNFEVKRAFDIQNSAFSIRHLPRIRCGIGLAARQIDNVVARRARCNRFATPYVTFPVFTYSRLALFQLSAFVISALASCLGEQFFDIWGEVGSEADGVLQGAFGGGGVAVGQGQLRIGPPRPVIGGVIDGGLIEAVHGEGAPLALPFLIFRARGR